MTSGEKAKGGKAETQHICIVSMRRIVHEMGCSLPA